MELLKELIADGEYFKAADHYLIIRYSKAFKLEPGEEIVPVILNGLIELVGGDEHQSAFELIGSLFNEIERHHQAVHYFKKAESLGAMKRIRYEEYGESLYEIGELVEAINKFDIAISLKPLASGLSYYYKAKSLEKLERYHEADAEFCKLVDVMPNTTWFLFEYAEFLEKQNNISRAIEILEKTLKVENGNAYFHNAAKAKLDSLRQRIQNDTIQKFTLLINVILDALKYSGEEIVHYTSISAIRSMVFEQSKFRLSEATQLNDPLEGEVLYHYLFDADSLGGMSGSDSFAYFPKPYIGSFVAKSKENNLTMWRMYGKEDGVEAAGCCISLNRKSFADVTKTRIERRSFSDDQNCPDLSSKIDYKPVIEFYHVAYCLKNGEFRIPGAQDKEKLLNSLCLELKEYANKKEIPFAYFMEQISKISYLFKGGEFSEEYEIRITVISDLIEPMIDYTGEKPKVFCEISLIHDSLSSICIGPKAKYKEETMSAFYYKLLSQGKVPKVSGSALRIK